MRLHFLIQAHYYPQRFESLTRTLLDINSTITAHIDLKSSIEDFKIENLSKNINFLTGNQRIKVNWAEWSQVEVTLNMLEKAFVNSEPDDYFILLSGDSFPVVPLNLIFEFFAQNKGQQFIGGAAMPTPHKPMSRISKRRWKYDKNESRAQLIPRILNSFKIPRFYRYKLMGLEPFAGPNWWALDWQAVDWILNKVSKSPKLIKLAKHSTSPDEFFFQTLIFNSPFKDKTNPSIMFQEWSSELNSGKRLNSNHIFNLLESDLMHQCDQENLGISFPKGYALFCRKVLDLETESEIKQLLWPLAEIKFNSLKPNN